MSARACRVSFLTTHKVISRGGVGGGDERKPIAMTVPMMPRPGVGGRSSADVRAVSAASAARIDALQRLPRVGYRATPMRSVTVAGAGTP
jgi:hypothetical protein